MYRRRVLAVGTAIVSAGCVSYTADDPEPDEPSSEELVRDAIETRTRMRDLAARRTVSIESSEETVERTERIFRRPPASQRIEVLESTDPANPAGSVSVTNRTTTWEYDPESNVVEKQYHPNKVDTDQTRRVLETLRSEYRLEYGGTATVDGREAHVIETASSMDDVGPAIDLLVGETVYRIPLDPTTDFEALTVSRTVWLDDEYRYPIKERNEVVDGEEPLHSVTVTYENLSIDEGLDAGTFTYRPPADAEIETEGTEPEGIFDSLEAAEQAAPYELPEPDVSEPYVLDRVTVVDKGENFGTVTTLWYDDPTVTTGELYVAVRDEQRFDPDALEEVEIDGLDGHAVYRRDGRIDSLFWTCESLSYEVSSPTTDEPLAEIASSVGCP